MVTEPAAAADFAEALEGSAGLWAGDPWLERTPWLVRGCIPYQSSEGWQLLDSSGADVPLARRFENPWPLFAISGGVPLTICGEWDGQALRPLSVFAEGRFMAMGGALA